VKIFGHLDFAMNNAGIAMGGVKTADTSLSMFEKVCNVNEKGASQAIISLSSIPIRMTSLGLTNDNK